MRKTTSLLVLIASLVLGACATNGPGPASSTGAIVEGVTVLEAGHGSLSLAYRYGADVIYMQALRGNPGAYPDEPTMPAFEVDARFVADDGVAFYIRQGGDDLIDPSWNADRQRQSESPITREVNDHLFLLGDGIAAVLRDAVTEQLGRDMAAQLAPEIDALVGSAADLPRAFARSQEFQADYRHWMGDPTGVPLPREERWQDSAPLEESAKDALHRQEGAPIEGATGEVAFGTSGSESDQRSLSAGYYYIAVHKECIYLCSGDHSATRIYEWVGSWRAVHNFCNHGSCANEMSEHGFLPWYEAVNDYSPSWTAQTCGTGYHWDSSNGGHNCHDDSRRQMMNFVYNRYPSRSSYHCSDNTSTNRWKSPRANASRDWGYNHPWHCQYTWSTDGTYSCPSSWQGTNDGCDCGCRFPDGTMADADCRP
jgi:hypothetical protein